MTPSERLQPEMAPAVLTVLVGLVQLVFGDASVMTDNFHSVKVCHNPLSIPVRNIKSIASRGYCASLCIRDSACFSYSVHNSTGLCYFNSELLTEDGCLDEFHHFNSELHQNEVGCQHDGIYNSNIDTCLCVNSYVGTRCQRLMTDCSDGLLSGYYTGQTGVFTLHPPTSPYPFQAYCEMEYGGETFIMRRSIDAPIDFNRSWSDYRDGFGDLNGNFWLGLEKVHYLTTSIKFLIVAEALMYEEDPSIPQGNYRQHYNLEFKVSSESNQFRFTTSINFPNGADIHVLGDCMTDTNGVPFSTYDNYDMSGSAGCSVPPQSGWWFKDCGMCNPTGILQPSSDTTVNPDPTYAHWLVSPTVNLAMRYLNFFLKY